MLNTSDNDSESEELILQSSPTQVLHKTFFQNNYNFKLNSNYDRIITLQVVEEKIEKDKVLTKAWRKFPQIKLIIRELLMKMR